MLLHGLFVAAFFAISNDCTFQPEPYRDQDHHTSDQSEDGWRGLARQECYSEAAALIAAYLDMGRSG